MDVRRRILGALAALAIGLALALLGSDGAAAVDRPPPAGPDARALRALGLRVRWPLAAATVTARPGTVLVIDIENLRRGRRRIAVQLRLQPVGADGLGAAIWTRRLYAGGVRLRLPRAGGSYRLSLTAGRLRYGGRVLIAARGAAPAGTTTAIGGTPSTPTPPRGGACVASLSPLAPTVVRAGASVGATVTDTGGGPCEIGFGASFAQLVGGQWIAAPTTNGSCGVASPDVVLLLAPGHSQSLGATVPDWFESGVYRVSLSGLAAQQISVTADPAYDPASCGGSASAAP